MGTIVKEKFVLRLKPVKIGEKRSDKAHNDEFSLEMHNLINMKFIAEKISSCWYDCGNYFFHEDWVEVIKKYT